MLVSWKKTAIFCGILSKFRLTGKVLNRRSEEKIQILIGRNQYTSEVLPWQATEIQNDRIVFPTIMFQGLCQTLGVYL